jgi:succinate dehydrogenase flavin-adding protein (antitoxin of CptAB toxin-antitoxin module)
MREKSPIVLDPAQRARLEFECRDVMRAFDAAMDQPTAESYDDLREATDQLMRAGAAILLALGRAE